MKRIITIYATLIFTAGVFAQVPEKMSYQTVIRDGNNALVTSTSVGIQISILLGSENGTAVYIETQMSTSNTNGLISIEIGAGTVLSGDFSTIDWANGSYFIKTEIDPTGGTNYSSTNTSQFLSVPYALYALKAGSSFGEGNYSHYIGEEYGGGVIFHLWKDNTGIEHGLIVTLTDQGTNQIWSNVILFIGVSSQSLWNGLSNSYAIVGQEGHTNSAAKLCLDLVSGGQSDWYLPTIQELNMLWNNYFTVARALSQIPGATQMDNPNYLNNYWSSEECFGDLAWGFSFDHGLAGKINKGNLCKVRAIRAF